MAPKCKQEMFFKNIGAGGGGGGEQATGSWGKDYCLSK